MKWEWRFSLKRLLVGVAIVCVFCAFPVLTVPVAVFAIPLLYALPMAAMANHLSRKAKRKDSSELQ